MTIRFLNGSFATENHMDEVAFFLADFDAQCEEKGEMNSWLANLLHTWNQFEGDGNM